MKQQVDFYLNSVPASRWSRLLDWLMAFRLKTLTAAVVPVLVGSSLAWRADWKIFVFAVLASIFIQIATNLVNDAMDFKKGADQEDRIGPKRLTASGRVSFNQVLGAAFLFFFLAMLCGLYLVQVGGWPIFWVGVFSLLAGYLYTGGPWPLAYLGLGDLFVVIFFGLVAVLGMEFLYVKSISPAGVVAGLQVGMLATVLIAINNLRDREGDLRANKKTLAVRFGRTFVLIEILLLFLFSYLLLLFWFFYEDKTKAAILPLVTLPMAFGLTKELFKEENLSPLRWNQLLARSAMVHLFFGIFLSVGLVL